MPVIHWTEIGSFNNIRKYAKEHPEILNGNSKVTYHAKVKLHGTNSGIQVHSDSRVVAQSRTIELSAGNDNLGFSRYVKETEQYWKNLSDRNMVVFGEWCGPGIQESVAISDIPNKIFAVFAIRFLSEDNDQLLVDPVPLALALGAGESGNRDITCDIPGTYVLPWHGPSIEIDWLATDEELAPAIAQINEWVQAVEHNDPWVEATFGVKGTGEGLVFYPRTDEHVGLKNFNNLVFKAKGEKHRVIKAAAPAQINAEVAAGVEQFVDMFLTTARLEQGVSATSSNGTLTFDVKLVGKFLAWIEADVLKESKDELKASNLDWSLCKKPLQAKARNWYIENYRANLS